MPPTNATKNTAEPLLLPPLGEKDESAAQLLAEIFLPVMPSAILEFSGAKTQGIFLPTHPKQMTTVLQFFPQNLQLSSPVFTQSVPQISFQETQQGCHCRCRCTLQEHPFSLQS